MNKYWSGAIIYDIFNQGFYYGGSALALIIVLGVRREKITDNPAHISKVNSHLGSPAKPSTCSTTSSVRNRWKCANFGAQNSWCAMTTQSSFPFPYRRLIISHFSVLIWEKFLHWNSSSMQNIVTAPTTTLPLPPMHTLNTIPPLVEKILKFQLFGSILSILYLPVSFLDDISLSAYSSFLDPSHS